MTDEEKDISYMKMALAEARRAAAAGEIPVGAVIVAGDRVVGRGHNLTETLADVTAHAEMQAITAAAATLGGKYLEGCTLYVTVEPCLMCAGAIGWSHLARIVVGTPDPKGGYTANTLRSPFHPRARIDFGILADECRAIMQDFFKSRRRCTTSS